MDEITREVVLSEIVQPLQGIRAVKGSPLTGRITQIVRHWPAGCNALVDLAVGHGDTWVAPNETNMYVALNDATPIIHTIEPIQKSEEIWMIVRNGDAINAHSISVTVVIMGVAGPPKPAPREA